MPAKTPNRITVEGQLAFVEIRRKDKTTTCAIIDAADVDIVRPYTWCLSAGGYAQTTVWGGSRDKITTLQMHSLLAKPVKPMEVDHINHNPLDNRRANLRVVPHYLNARNKFLAGNVHWWITRGAWRVRFQVNGKAKDFGCFKTREEAEARAAELRPRFLAGEDI